MTMMPLRPSELTAEQRASLVLAFERIFGPADPEARVVPTRPTTSSVEDLQRPGRTAAASRTSVSRHKAA